MEALVNRIVRIPAVHRVFWPMSRWYRSAAGYRQLGLRFDDLMPEENDTVQLALKRLPPNEAYDRVYRIRRAFQCSLEHQQLPLEEQTKEHEDVHYLKPLIDEIEQENKEREDLDSMVVRKD